MSFISHGQAEQIADWEKTHPEAAKNYYKEHSELSQLFINKKISYEEFKNHSDELKNKYKYLER